MKKIISMVAATIITAGTTAFATEQKSDPATSQKTNYELAFTRMVVENDITIVLVESPETMMEFTGADADIAKVDWKIKNGELRIKSRKGSLKGKVTLTITVSQLKELYIKGESSIKSAGYLNSCSLKVTIDEGCRLALKNNGNIQIVARRDIELEVEHSVGNVTFG